MIHLRLRIEIARVGKPRFQKPVSDVPPGRRRSTRCISLTISTLERLRDE